MFCDNTPLPAGGSLDGPTNGCWLPRSQLARANAASASTQRPSRRAQFASRQGLGRGGDRPARALRRRGRTGRAEGVGGLPAPCAPYTAMRDFGQDHLQTSRTKLALRVAERVGRREWTWLRSAGGSCSPASFRSRGSPSWQMGGVQKGDRELRRAGVHGGAPGRHPAFGQAPSPLRSSLSPRLVGPPSPLSCFGFSSARRSPSVWLVGSSPIATVSVNCTLARRVCRRSYATAYWAPSPHSSPGMDGLIRPRAPLFAR